MKKELSRNERSALIRKLTGAAMLTAIVVILQLLGSFIRFGVFSVSLVLVPIVIGAALFGPWISAWLGLVFGVTVLLSGDAAAFLAYHIPGTIITVLLKGTLAGLVAGFVYRFVEKKNRYFATLISAMICPLVNTGVFLLGCRVFLWDAVTDMGILNGYTDAALFAIAGLVGLNFIAEFVFNCVLTPVIVRLVDLIGKRFRRA